MSEAAEELDEFTEDEVINLKEEPEKVDEPAREAPEGSTEEPTEAPPGEVEEKPKVEFDENQQAVFNDVVAKKVAAQREAERKAEEAARKAAELEQKLQKYETPDRPEVPPLPDPYDDDYEAKVQARDSAIAEQTRWDNEQQQRQAAQIRAQQEAQFKQQQANDEIAKSFVEKGDKVGFTEVELDTAVGTLVDQGIHGEKARHILTHESGPDMTMYLARNALEADKVATMSEMQAAIYLETVVLPKVKASKTTPEPSPAVVETPGAGAGIPDDDYGAKGWSIT